MKRTSIMKKIYNSRVFWAIVSLALSLTIWVYVTSIESDEYRLVFRNVPVELVGDSTLIDSKNLAITDLDVTKVNVEISGPRRIVGSLSATDLIAQVDVSKLSQPAYTSQTYSVAFPDGTDTSKVTVIKKSPEIVNFMVSNIIDKTIPVKGSFEGSIAEGYTAQKTEFEPSTVTVSGPEAKLKNVEYAWLTFGEENLETTISTETVFKLMDANGEECDSTGLSFSTETVMATLQILEVKKVPLDISINYGAGANESNTQKIIEPQYITLSGDSAILNDYNKIVLGVVDTTKFAASTEAITYPIIFDNELNNITGLTEATVRVEITGLETRTFNITNIQLGSVPAGFEAALNEEQVQVSVTIRGPKEELDLLDDINLAAIVDWTDFNGTLGAQALPAKIRIDADGVSNCGAIYDYTISVVVGKAG